MALSFCSDWESPLQQLDSKMLSYSTSFHNQQQQQQAQVLNSSCFDQFPDTFIDPYLPPDEFSYYNDSSCSSLLPYLSSSPSDALISSLSPDTFPLEDFESMPPYQLLPKRQKNDYHYDSSFATNYFYGGCMDMAMAMANPPSLVPEIPAQVVEPSKTESSVKKQNNNGSSLSVQSIAARERRRKITEKTQELGKLIPGGHRMNTAEMFQAASKYVKFLQAQVKLLQQVELTKKEMKEPFHTLELQNLLASPIIQENLYSEEKCLVPKEFVEAVANEPAIQSKPMVVEGIDQLLRTNG